MVIETSSNPNIDSRQGIKGAQALASAGLLVAGLSFWSLILYYSYHLLANAFVQGAFPHPIGILVADVSGIDIGVALWLIGVGILPRFDQGHWIPHAKRDTKDDLDRTIAA